MLEGWADFFEAVAAARVPLSSGSNIQYWAEYPSQWPASHGTLPEGPGNELRVASFLYDLYDAPGDNGPTDDDLIQPQGTPEQRFRNVALHANNLPVSAELKQMWLQNIKPTLSGSALSAACTTLKDDTLGSIDPSC